MFIVKSNFMRWTQKRNLNAMRPFRLIDALKYLMLINGLLHEESNF